MKTGIASMEPVLHPAGDPLFWRTMTEHDMQRARLVLYRSWGEDHHLSTALNQAREHRIEVSVVLIDNPKEPLDGFASWCARTVDRYRLRHVVIWNEPNKRMFWYRSPEAYGHLLTDCYREIHKLGTTTISGFGLAARSSAKVPAAGVFLERALHKHGRIMDEFSYHPYPFSPNESAVGVARRVDKMIELLNHLGRYRMPINIDEISWTKNTPAKRRKENLKQLEHLLSKMPRVRSMLVYRMQPEGVWPGWLSHV